MSRTKPIATPEQFEGLTLMRLRIENSRRVRLVDISIDQTLTMIGGDNAQGKSSVLSALPMCVGDKKAIKAITLNPVHDGQQTGEITCDFGDGTDVKLTVRKTLKRVGNKDFETELDVDIPGYIPPSRIQDFLDKLAGEIAFDPLAFDQMPEKAQFEALRKFVPDFDFKENQDHYDAVFAQRTAVNGDLKKALAAAAAIELTEQPPCERIDEDALTAELREAGDHNLDVEQRRSNRATASTRIATLRATAQERLARIDVDSQQAVAQHADVVADLERQIRELQQRIQAKNEAHQERLVEIRRVLTAEAESATRQADEIQAKIDAAEPLRSLKDAAAIEQKLQAARQSNKVLDAWEALRKRKSDHQAEADSLAEDAEALTASLSQLQADRQQAIRKAHLPVDGLGFGDGYVTLNGSRWGDASTAERVDASTAIAMALNPKLRVIIIRDGANLASKMRERIRQRAAEKGYRVLMEVVDDTGANSHVFIEDGLMKAIPLKAGAA